MAFIAPKHEGAKRPHGLSAINTMRARVITILYPVGTATMDKT